MKKEVVKGKPNLTDGYEFLREFNPDRFKEVHKQALTISGDRPYNVKNVRTFNHIIWQMNEYGKQKKVDPYQITLWTLRETIQMSDSNKPFENGNHRTAWALAQTILRSFRLNICATIEEKDKFGELCIFWSDEECIDWFKAKASSEI